MVDQVSMFMDTVSNRDINIDTFSLNRFDYNNEFFLFKRPVNYGYFKFAFIDHNSGKEIKNVSGYLYLEMALVPFVTRWLAKIENKTVKYFTLIGVVVLTFSLLI